MKSKILTGLAIIIILSIVAGLDNMEVMAQWSNKNSMITSIVLERFENNDRNWKAEGSKYTKRGYPQIKLIENWPAALFGRKGDPNNKYCLGVRTSFYRRGYNYLWIYPEKPITIPGEAKAFYIWVWGANFNYDMEMIVQDYKGISYTLKVGRLNYLGWKVHRIDVPVNIPQFRPQVPRLQRLKFIRFTIWSLPGSWLEDFYVYLDYFTVLTDITNETFDGDDLAKDIDAYWSNSNTQSNNNG